MAPNGRGLAGVGAEAEQSCRNLDGLISSLVFTRRVHNACDYLSGVVKSKRDGRCRNLVPALGIERVQ